MDWSHEPLSDAFRAFKARMCLFLEDQEVTEAGKQATKIKIALGDEGMRRILASGLSAQEQCIPTRIWDLIESEVDATVKINFRVHRLEFANMKQKPGETISHFLSRLREKANKCEFENAELNERLIEMIILCTPFEDFRKELLTKAKGHAVGAVLERGREYEAVAASTASLRSMNIQNTEAANPNTNHHIDAIRKSSNGPFANAPQTGQPLCRNCGLKHNPRACPAYRDTCSACKAKGHWRKMCRKTNGGTCTPKMGPQSDGEFKSRRPHNVHQHEVDLSVQATPKITEDPPEQCHQVYHAITISNVDMINSSSAEAFAELLVSHIKPPVSGPLRVKVDTGSGGNTLPLRTFRQMFHDTPVHCISNLEPNVQLTSYSGNRIPCLGSIHLNVRKSSQTTPHQAKFYVVDVSGPAILGLPSCRALNIVDLQLDAISHQPCAIVRSLNQPYSLPTKLKSPITSVQQLKAAYPNQFDRIGKFKQPAQLLLKEDATPSCDAPRKVSVNLLPKIREELNKMESDGIIRRVTAHSDWCSSLVYVTKPDGSLRICLDPKKLNKSLRRCPHKIPTLEELNPTFTGAQFFSKLDAKAGYWSIPLDEGSQLLTTFRTPIGRYCWMRLPFGLNVSQDIFQSRMDTLLEGLPGVASIADDVVCVENLETSMMQTLYASLTALLHTAF